MLCSLRASLETFSQQFHVTGANKRRGSKSCHVPNASTIISHHKIIPSGVWSISNLNRCMRRPPVQFEEDVSKLVLTLHFKDSRQSCTISTSASSGLVMIDHHAVSFHSVSPFTIRSTRVPRPLPACDSER
jgi:hypothetical protein